MRAGACRPCPPPTHTHMYTHPFAHLLYSAHVATRRFRPVLLLHYAITDVAFWGCLCPGGGWAGGLRMYLMRWGPCHPCPPPMPHTHTHTHTHPFAHPPLRTPTPGASRFWDLSDEATVLSGKAPALPPLFGAPPPPPQLRPPPPLPPPRPPPPSESTCSLSCVRASRCG